MSLSEKQAKKDLEELKNNSDEIKKIKESLPNTTQNKEELSGDWKDRELDDIWHHGLKRVKNGEIDVYHCLNYIELKIQKLLDKSILQAHQSGIEEERKRIAQEFGKIPMPKINYESFLAKDYSIELAGLVRKTSAYFVEKVEEITGISIFELEESLKENKQ